MDIVTESLAIAKKTTASSKRSATHYDPQLHLSNRWPVELHQWPSIIILTSDTKLDFQTDYIDDVDVIITAESLTLWHSQLGPPNQRRLTENITVVYEVSFRNTTLYNHIETLERSSTNLWEKPKDKAKTLVSVVSERLLLVLLWY
jgi:hypothetical protein